MASVTPSLLRGILPVAIAVVEQDATSVTYDEPDAWAVVDERWVAGAVDRRRSEFLGARRCAREAMKSLGVTPVPIPVGPHREPCWPAGVVGSITHCASYQAAAVGRARELRSIGIDVERHEQLPEGVLTVVSDEGERLLLDELAGIRPGIHWDAVLFSAKESVFKAWFPVERAWLGFRDAELAIDPHAGSFTATVRVQPRRGRTAYSGRWAVAGGLVATAVVDDRARL